MRRARAALLVLAAVAVAALALATRGDSTGERLADAVAAAAAERPVEVLDLTEVVPGDWDTMYVFGGYSLGATVSAALGHDWGQGRPDEEIAVPPNHALAFTRDGEVVELVRNFGAAAMTCFDLGRGYPADRLRVRVRQWPASDGTPRRLLVPPPHPDRPPRLVMHARPDQPAEIIC